MNVTQVSTILNTYILPDILGGSTIATEDLSNIVDIGIEIGNSGAYDKYVKKCVNHIGKVKVMDRVISGNAPKIYKEAWKYGSIMELLSFELPDAIANDQQQLTNGNTYNQDVFYQPDVDVKFYNDKVSWTIPMSFLANGSSDDRIAQSFSSAQQCVNFWSGIELAIENALTLQIDSLIMRTLNYYIAKQMYEDIIADATAGTGFNDYSTVRCVNLLKDYNSRFSKNLTAADCMTDTDFLKYASYIMALTMDRMTKASTIFNMEGKTRQTPKNSMHFVTLSEFERSSEMYLQADTFHDELVKLPGHETVPAWQTPGQTYAFEDTSAVKCKVKAVVSDVETSVTVDINGIIAIMFDDYAASVTNFSQNTTSHYNAKGDFINTFYNVVSGYNNMYDQNFVIFFVADPTPAGD